MMALSFIRKEGIHVVGVTLAAGSIVAATLVGAVMGRGLRNIRTKAYEILTAIAAGIMLCAAIHGLLLPAVALSDMATGCVVMGVGAFLLAVGNRIAEEMFFGEADALHKLHGLLFVCAIVIHHFPEGMAAGVSFGTGVRAETLSVCTAIALQNVPEAMMILPAMSGFSHKKVAAALFASGGVELLGLVMGYCAVKLSVALLPVMLALAAGAMLFVVFDSMLADIYGTDSHGGEILCGYCGMLLLTELIECFL